MAPQSPEAPPRSLVPKPRRRADAPISGASLDGAAGVDLPLPVDLLQLEVVVPRMLLTIGDHSSRQSRGTRRSAHEGTWSGGTPRGARIGWADGGLTPDV